MEDLEMEMLWNSWSERQSHMSETSTWLAEIGDREWASLSTLSNKTNSSDNQVCLHFLPFLEIAHVECYEGKYGSEKRIFNENSKLMITDCHSICSVREFGLKWLWYGLDSHRDKKLRGKKIEGIRLICLVELPFMWSQVVCSLNVARRKVLLPQEVFISPSPKSHNPHKCRKRCRLGCVCRIHLSVFTITEVKLFSNHFKKKKTEEHVENVIFWWLPAAYRYGYGAS